ncbi:possible membrane protein [Vibrio maritimus]|uniref:Possible membrane protein n=1 Tax=Vibrio maritimus TaxID=990268 RepID=A0A090S6F9_9VIBR|nr:possible membrane protein [Vibrio maritimus]
MTYLFKNLIFEGGGVKGLTYLGALEVLEQKILMHSIERVGGTSAGAINAVLLSLDYTHQEMHDILWKLDFGNFLDEDWGFVRDAKRLTEEFGWYKGDYFRSWIAELIEAKTGNPESTFAELESMKIQKGFRSIYLVGTNISTSFSEVFSAENTPNVCIADAVRISMSIPLFFSAKRSLRGDVYVDGGLLRNYPIKLFDYQHFIEDTAPVGLRILNKETLGFRLDSKEDIDCFRDHKEPKKREINDLFDYTAALINTVLEAQQSRHLNSEDWKRTVYIDTKGVNTTDFDLSDERKAMLVQSGRDGCEHYFNWLDSQLS